MDKSLITISAAGSLVMRFSGQLQHIDAMKRYLWNILVSIDQLINVVLFFGDPDETMSSRMGKHVAKHDCPFCNFMCKLLNFIQKDHCK